MEIWYAKLQSFLLLLLGAYSAQVSTLSSKILAAVICRCLP